MTAAIPSPALDHQAVQAAMPKLYEAALLPELWPAALADFAAAAGGTGATLTHPAPHDAQWMVATDNLMPVMQAYVRGNWAARNFRIKNYNPALHQGDAFLPETAMLAPTAIDREPIQAELFGCHGMRAFIGFQAGPGVLGCIERGNRPAADWELNALMQTGAQMAQIGFLASARGQARDDGVAEALDLLDRPAVLLDRRGGVLRMTAAAETLFSQICTLQDGQPVPRQAAMRPAFEALLAAALKPPSRNDAFATARALGPLALPRAGGRPVLVRAAPLARRAHDIFARGKALLLLLDPDRGMISAAQLVKFFGLTRAEARLAQGLAAGRSLTEMTALLGVGRETLRSQLAQIFRKTGTRRQAELVTLLIRLSMEGSS